ncbi:hypothetical protein [Streptomyces specialis]|uniref:hypothetical protein n=1 Tax=Streptomyces specialis TaxID=498367 RepID=UPI000AAA1AD5|nr:hypothetical protein [Streptomyces specialis]
MDALFDAPQAPPEPVLMSLNPQYYDLIWQGLKRHEFRRRFLTGRAVTWYVYLTAPVSRLAAVIDLDPAVVDSPERIAAIAEQARPGNGDSVLDYLKDLPRGSALPTRGVREHEGLTAARLPDILGAFHPPQGYTLISRSPQWTRVCRQMAAGPLLRQMTLPQPAPVG